ncbi:MAG TPA: serine/threonine-protein kinase, partial [Polyangiaceae bacterium]|nr:serine/threonine-protein kinase [Polyangiaceae bacterium]
MAIAPARTLVGSVLSGRWRVVQRLGAGGMGEVYAAEPVAGGARVAVKILRPEFAVDPVVVARFAEEGRTCTRLVHPNIVRIVDGGTSEEGSPFIVMDLLDGVPLSAYTQNGERVPTAQAVPILQGILAGLAAAHAQGVVHRDLKPDNVFLTRHPGGMFVVKVLDFGVAKVMDAAGGMGSRTRSGILLGTPAYMSPEQVKGATDVDQRADLWSAGVLLYEMLTGRAAFPAPTEYARLLAVLSTEPEPIERVDPALAPLAPFVVQALNKNRDHRFGSAIEMARALAAAASNEALGTDWVVGAVAPSGTLARLPAVPSSFASWPGTSPAATSVLAHTAPAPLGVAPQPGAEPLKREKPGGTLVSPADLIAV